MLEANAPEVILALPARPVPARHMRSTILLGSMSSLRQAGYFERYAASLDPRHRDTLLQAVAGVWIPVDAALAHYRACESLGLAPDAVVDLGAGPMPQTNLTFHSCP